MSTDVLFSTGIDAEPFVGLVEKPMGRFLELRLARGGRRGMISSFQDRFELADDLGNLGRNARTTLFTRES